MSPVGREDVGSRWRKNPGEGVAGTPTAPKRWFAVDGRLMPRLRYLEGTPRVLRGGLTRDGR
jgi:hypothetical protein